MNATSHVREQTIAPLVFFPINTIFILPEKENLKAQVNKLKQFFATFQSKSQLLLPVDNHVPRSSCKYSSSSISSSFSRSGSYCNNGQGVFPWPSFFSAMVYN